MSLHFKLTVVPADVCCAGAHFSFSPLLLAALAQERLFTTFVSQRVAPTTVENCDASKPSAVQSVDGGDGVPATASRYAFAQNGEDFTLFRASPADRTRRMSGAITRQPISGQNARIFLPRRKDLPVRC